MRDQLHVKIKALRLAIKDLHEYARLAEDGGDQDRTRSLRAMVHQREQQLENALKLSHHGKVPI
jgi:phage shock protein A